MSDIKLKHFNSEEAFRLGTMIHEQCTKQHRSVGIEIHLYGRTVFQFLPNTLGPDKADWLRRKRNTVLYFGMSSKAMYEKCGGEESLLVSKYAKEGKDYTLTPGSIPIAIENSGIIGALTLTGLLPEEDHQLAVTSLEKIAKEISGNE